MYRDNDDKDKKEETSDKEEKVTPDIIYASGDIDDQSTRREFYEDESTFTKAPVKSEFSRESEDRSREDTNTTTNKRRRSTGGGSGGNGARTKGGRLSYFIVALVAAIIGGLVSQVLAPYIFKDSGLPEMHNTNRPEYTINPSDDITSVSAVAKSNMSSVVGITTVEVQQFFFSLQEVEGVGSGVIVDPNGYILTNSHVVGDGRAKSLHVIFEDGEKVEGEVLWNDRSLDLAMVKVDKKGLPVAKLGDSDALQVGELAVAIGNPLGLDFQRSVTAGVISGLNRTIEVNEIVMENLIQTDASINRGNSGGPLLNSKGEVIGINTVKVSSGEGLGFSIPINSIKPIISEVTTTGTHKTVVLGVTGVGVEEYQATLGIKLSTDKGIILVEVVSGGPAHKAGLTASDIITAVDGREINSMSDLKATLYKYKKGDKASFDVIRNGEKKKIEVTFSATK